MRALGEHGIEVAGMPFGCHDADVAVSLTNDVVGATERDDPGFVACSLRRRPPEGAGSTLRKHTEQSVTTFSLANLECSFSPSPYGALADDQVRALERALRALERTLR